MPPAYCQDAPRSALRSLPVSITGQEVTEARTTISVVSNCPLCPPPSAAETAQPACFRATSTSVAPLCAPLQLPTAETGGCSLVKTTPGNTGETGGTRSPQKLPAPAIASAIAEPGGVT